MPEALLFLCALAAIAFVPLAFLKAGHAWKVAPRTTSRPVLVTLGLILLIAVSAGIFVTVASPGMQVFAQFGLAKRITLPAIYSIVVIAVVAIEQRNGVKPQMWWWFLLGLIFVSSALEIVVPRQTTSFLDLAQSVALVAGLLATTLLGMKATEWSPHDVAVFFVMVLLVALIATYTNVSTTPFNVLQVPAGFSLLYATFRAPGRRFLSFVGALLLLVPSIYYALTDTSASIAVIAEICAGAVLLIVFLAPPPLRNVALIAGTVAALLLALRTSIWRILLGGIEPEWDVTLVHRAYETNAVLANMISNPITFIFGGGPGATVDLSASPDVSTLRGAGREVTAVDDVHLLTSWVMMKFGVLGLVWLAIFLVALVRQVIRIAGERERFSLDVVMLFFVAAAVAAALPAATNLFSNPLAALCIGVLTAREYRRRMGAAGKPLEEDRDRTAISHLKKQTPTRAV